MMRWWGGLRNKRPLAELIYNDNSTKHTLRQFSPRIIDFSILTVISILFYTKVMEIGYLFQENTGITGMQLKPQLPVKNTLLIS